MKKCQIRLLDDTEMDKVVGGIDIVDISAGILLPSIFSCCGCLIASCVYFSKGDGAKNKDNMSDYYKYFSKAKNCVIAAMSLFGVSAIATIAAATGGELNKRNL